MVGEEGSLEGMVIDQNFWLGKRVLLTGHTGFKGSWLGLWLLQLGARVTGCALEPASSENLFQLSRLADDLEHSVVDIRDSEAVRELVKRTRPEIIIHMAAQSLVRYSYAHPLETYQTNVMGTLHLLEAVRNVDCVQSCIVVTSDKCYENLERPEPYRETDSLGGHDPYSSSKACAEVLTSSWYRSYFAGAEHSPSLATVRAGNVLGGGDWAEDRIVPDLVRAMAAGESLKLRNPSAVRPWQHVLEPLSGYLLLAQALAMDGNEYAGAWNFGPDAENLLPVSELADRLVACWGDGASWLAATGEEPHEAGLLALDSAKAQQQLGWRPRLDVDSLSASIVHWYREQLNGADARQLCLQQIADFEAAA
ncbi:MAG: CDP-glucose 4,6-dehydratase [Halieaceae bacterium]